MESLSGPFRISIFPIKRFKKNALFDFEFVGEILLTTVKRVKKYV